jgi:hypothetical protein
VDNLLVAKLLKFRIANGFFEVSCQSDATQRRTEDNMSISEPADMARAESTSTLDQEIRLSPGSALVVIVVLSAAAWSAVVFGVIALMDALQ